MILKSKLKIILPTLLIFLLTSFRNQENDIEGLKIKFNKVSNVAFLDIYNKDFGSFPVGKFREGNYKMLKLTLSNEGNKDCTFNFKDTYISTQKDSLYRFSFFYGYSLFKTKIKPKKEITRIAYYEFPEDDDPKDLFIEDRRFTIKVE